MHLRYVIHVFPMKCFVKPNEFISICSTVSCLSQTRDWKEKQKPKRKRKRRKQNRRIKLKDGETFKHQLFIYSLFSYSQILEKSADFQTTAGSFFLYIHRAIKCNTYTTLCYSNVPDYNKQVPFLFHHQNKYTNLKIRLIHDSIE